MPVIELQGIGKKYSAYSNRREQLKKIVTFGKAGKSHDFWALRDLDLKIERGSTLGILGRNGAGKSTLLKIISGVVTPTTGTVEVKGRLAALFGLGAGFNPEFTGRDNVMLNGLLLGIEREEVLERLPEIERFADIGPFMDQPIKTYSSGMRARLGFAVAVSVEPDILVVDETLAVGDAVFKQASLQKMYDLRDRGTTVLFVSHSMGMVQNFCDEALLLHKGELLIHGEIDATLEQYQALIGRAKANRNMAPADAKMEYMIEHEDAEDLEGVQNRAAKPTGDTRVKVVKLLDENRNPTTSIDSGAQATIRVSVEYLESVPNSRVGIVIRDASGLDLLFTETAREGTDLGERRTEEQIVLDFTTNVPLRPGHYTVQAGSAKSPDEPLAWTGPTTEFEVLNPENGDLAPEGLIHLPATVKVHEAVQKQESSNRSV
jgi:ABC-type polysaccharide/polyol phosphate transport system ATPase subunit